MCVLAQVATIQGSNDATESTLLRFRALVHLFETDEGNAELRQRPSRDALKLKHNKYTLVNVGYVWMHTHSRD